MRNLSITYVPVKDLKPYKNNARKHVDYDVNAIAASIKEFGFNDAIGIWSDQNIIVEGHGRLLAAKKLGMKEVPCVRLDHMSDEQRRAYALAHNQTALNSDWDMDVLLEELDSISGIDMSEFGFNLDDDEPKEVVEDNYEVELPEEPISVPGDLYILGDHRLLCGDSTSLDQVGVLMDGLKADLVVTDPPYNMAYQGAGNTKDRASKKILNDHMSDEKFDQFMRDVYSCYMAYMANGASIYVFYKELGSAVFIKALTASGLTFKQELIWVKNQIVIGGSAYQSMYEPCILGCKGKKPKTWNGARKQRSVIESVDLMTEDELREQIKDLLDSEVTDVIREKKNLINDLHPTMKPIRLLAKFIENSSNQSDVVLDLFGGSGSTLIACEQLNRRCFTAELDPKYCDVIVDRWQKFTGREAQLVRPDEE